MVHKSKVKLLPLSFIILILLSLGCFFDIREENNLEITLATEDICVGTNRFAFVASKINGFINQPTLNIIFESPSNKFKLEKRFEFLEFPPLDVFLEDSGNLSGIYVSEVDFSEEGQWSLFVENIKGELKSNNFNVNLNCNSIGIGQISPKSESRTLKEVSIEEITTAAEPISDFYRISIKNALNNLKPTLILFSSPAFCTSPVCGPQLESAKLINSKYGNSVNIIHVDTYLNVQEIRFDFSKRKLTPILKEWGIGEDQWTFLIDSNGLVVAKFENFVSEKEIAHYIDQLIN